MMTGAKRRKLSRFHAVTGVLFSIPLLVIGITGVLLGFYDSLRYASFPYRLERAVTQTLPASAIADAARGALPGEHLESLYLPAATDRAARGKLKGEGGKTSLVFLDPSTGKVLEIRDASKKDRVELLHDLHRGRIGGIAGEWLAAAAAFSVLLLWLSALFLGRGNGARHLHGRMGRGVGAGILCVIALSGAVLAFAKPLRDNLYPAPRLATAAKSAPADLDHLVAIGTTASESITLERVIFPSDDRDPLTLRFDNGARVYLNQKTGALLGAETTFTPWLNLLYPLHSGRLMGSAGPPLVAAFGLLLLYLTASGLRLYGRSRSRRCTHLMQARDILNNNKNRSTVPGPPRAV